jgi:hypothetical protein
MERENKKVRDDKKKEFVQCVRVSHLLDSVLFSAVSCFFALSNSQSSCTSAILASYRAWSLVRALALTSFLTDDIRPAEAREREEKTKEAEKQRKIAEQKRREQQAEVFPHSFWRGAVN